MCNLVDSPHVKEKNESMSHTSFAKMSHELVLFTSIVPSSLYSSISENRICFRRPVSARVETLFSHIVQLVHF